MILAVMEALERPGKITKRDLRAARVWQWLPWLASLVIAFGPPAIFALISLLASANAAVYLVVALSLIPFSVISAIISGLILLLFRRRWARQLRERLASDGVTADE